MEKKDDLNVRAFYYDILDKLITESQHRNIGTCAGIYEGNQLIAVTYYLIYRDVLYIVQNAGDNNKRKLAGMHKLFFELIERHKNMVKEVNFFGSNLEKVAMFLRNFSNIEIEYQYLSRRFI